MKDTEQMRKIKVLISFIYYLLIIPCFYYPHHIFLISCFSDYWCFWCSSQYISSIYEKLFKFFHSLFDYLFISRNSSFSEILLSDFKLRLIESIYISCLMGESMKYWNYLREWDKRHIYRNHIILYSWRKVTNICILIRSNSLICSDTIIEL
jgi:hypothetical protein